MIYERFGIIREEEDLGYLRELYINLIRSARISKIGDAEEYTYYKEDAKFDWKQFIAYGIPITTFAICVLIALYFVSHT